MMGLVPLKSMLQKNLRLKSPSSARLKMQEAQLQKELTRSLYSLEQGLRFVLLTFLVALEVFNWIFSCVATKVNSRIAGRPFFAIKFSFDSKDSNPSLRRQSYC